MDNNELFESSNLVIPEVPDTDESTYEGEMVSGAVEDFEISGIEIEEGMPEDLKAAIAKYNEIHSRTVNDIMSDEQTDHLEVQASVEESLVDEDNITENIDDTTIVEDDNSVVDLSDIF